MAEQLVPPPLASVKGRRVETPSVTVRVFVEAQALKTLGGPEGDSNRAQSLGAAHPPPRMLSGRDPLPVCSRRSRC